MIAASASETSGDSLEAFGHWLPSAALLLGIARYARQMHLVREATCSTHGKEKQGRAGVGETARGTTHRVGGGQPPRCAITRH